MSGPFDRSRARDVLPQFERLEDRLLLTTLEAGQFFVYHNSQDETVRLSLWGQGAIEVFAHHQDTPSTNAANPAGGLGNMPGLLWTGAGWQTVGWDGIDDPMMSTHILRPDDPYSNQPFDQQSFTEIEVDDPIWIEYGDYLPDVADPDPAQELDWQRVVRGSRAEIFGIYVAECTMSTTLTVTTLTGIPYSSDNWDTSINPWTSNTLPLISEYFTQPGVVSPPADSGGAIIGAVHSPARGNFPRWVGVPQKTVFLDVPLTGKFPGPGAVSAGIVVADEIYRIQAVEPLGTDILGIAADGLGSVFAVNSNAFHSNPVNLDPITGDMGGDIRAIASLTDPLLGLRETYVVDNAPAPIYTTGTDQFVQQTVGLAVNANGLFFAVNESNRQLVTSTDTGGINQVGTLVDSLEGDAFSFSSFRGLDFNPGTGELWGIATLIDADPNSDPPVDEPGPWLVRIATTANAGNESVVTRVQVLATPEDPDPEPWDPDNAPELTTIAWDPAGTQLYGVTTTNQLCEIDTTTGIYKPVGFAAAGDPDQTLTEGANDLPPIVGIDFLGQTLYGLTNDGQMLYVDDAIDANVDTSRVVVLGDSGLSDLTCVAYDHNNPARLYTVAFENGLNRLTAIAPYSSLKDVDDVTGVAVTQEVLSDIDPNLYYAFRDVTALEIRDIDPDPLTVPTWEMYGVGYVADLDVIDANVPSADPILVMIDRATGEVTEVLDLGTVGITDLTTIALNTGADPEDATDDILYGVEPGAELLHEIDAATWTVTGSVALDTPGLVGLSMVELHDTSVGAGNPMLMGVDETSLYTVDPATGTCTLLDVTGATKLTGLTFNGDLYQPRFYSVDHVDYDPDPAVSGDDFRLVTVPLSASLLSWHPSTGVEPESTRMLLLENLFIGDRDYVYTNIQGLDFDAFGTLWAVADPVYLPDPLNNPLDDGTGNPWLITIDLFWSGVTPVAQLTNPAPPPANVTLSTISFGDPDGDGTETLYGFVADIGTALENQIVQIDTATGEVSNGLLLSLPLEVVGLDFIGDQIYAVTPGVLYTVERLTGLVTQVPEGYLPGGVSSLSGDTDIAGQDLLWVANLFPDGYYRLLKAFTDPTMAVQDLGRMVVGGTVAGEITNTGNIDTVRVGFLWGGVAAGKNINAVVMKEGGGGRPAGNWFTYQADLATYVGQSQILADGVINFVDSRGDERLHSAVQATSDDMIAPLGTDVLELEYIVHPNFFNSAWLLGYMPDYTNDTFANAQYLNHPTGTIDLWGTSSTYEASATLPDGTNLITDFYALPMLGSQTITIDAYVVLLGMLIPFLDAPLGLHFYDSDGHWMDSVGWETNEDWGVGSRGVTQKVMNFTAPAAGVYYMGIVNYSGFTYDYLVNITDATGSAIGGVNVEGDYFGAIHFGTGEGANYEISAKNNGHIGGYTVSGSSYYTSMRTFGGGDIVTFQAGEIGTTFNGFVTVNAVSSEGRIGRVASTWGYVAAAIDAGLTPAGASAPLWNDAFIQHVYGATDIIQTMPPACWITATGSIAVIEAEDTLENILIQANSDWQIDPYGPPGHVDLIEVGGDYGTAMGPPLLERGPKGDIGYVHVGGTIYVDYGAWVGPLVETVKSEGQTVTLNDDGGGRLVVTPMPTPELDANGDVVLDQYNQPVMYMPTISYGYIGVDDDMNPGVGDGGVIANLRIDGSATLQTIGATQVSHLDLNYDPATSTTRSLQISGNAPVDIYYATSDVPVDAISNSTAGSLVSGALLDIGSISLAHGSLGVNISDTGQWLHGPDDAPVVANVAVEPQYGWYHGKVNGLQVTGNLDYVSVGGYLGDLRVTGTLGTVYVNSDHVREPDQWHGVQGIVWTGERLDYIDVGHGLADDGPSDVAKAAILSTFTIGRVAVQGPWREINGVVFGEINGSILGGENDTIDITVTDPTQTQPTVGGQTVLGPQGFGVAQVVTTQQGAPVYSGAEWQPGGANAAWTAGDANPAWLPGGPGAQLTGQTITVERDAVGSVIGTEGAHMTAIVGGVGLDSFQCMVGGFIFGGGVGRVDFSGLGAYVRGSEAAGYYVRDFAASSGAVGMENSFITGSEARPNELAVGRVAAAGFGMQQVIISANGGNIGTIEGLDAESDIREYVLTYIDPDTGLPTELELPSAFTSTDGIDTIRARDLMQTRISAPGTVGSIHMTRDVQDNYDPFYTELHPFTLDPMVNEAGPNVLVGAILSMSVGGNFTNNSFAVAGEFGKLLIEGEYINSMLRLPGAAANLKHLEVHGNLNGGVINYNAMEDRYVEAVEIQSAGQMGSIISDGRITADLRTTGMEGAICSDIGMIRTLGGFYADLDVAGSLGTFECATDLGTNPAGQTWDGNLATENDLQIFNIQGGMGTLRVAGTNPFGVASNLYADFNVGGTIDQIDIEGSLYGHITSLGDIKKVVVDGKFGGDPGDEPGATQGPAGQWGAIEAYGSIGTLTFAKEGDLVADIISGGSIKKLSAKNRNIFSDIVSRYGDVLGITLTNGDLLGSVSGQAIGNIKVKNGSIRGDITATSGGIKSVYVTGQKDQDDGLFANVVATNGRIGKLSVKNGDVGEVGTDYMISATGGFKSFQVSNGDLLANVDSGGVIDALRVKGGDVNAATIGSDGGIKKLDVKGGLLAATVRSGAKIERLNVSGDVLNSDISAGWHIGKVKIGGTMDGSTMQAGHDIGQRTASVFLGDGLGGFLAIDPVAIGSDPGATILGDVNNDTALDLVVANPAAGSVSVLLGYGNGTFGARRVYRVGDTPTAMALADINGDTLVDLLVVNQGDDTVSILLGDGDGTFTYPSEMGQADTLDVGDAPVSVLVTQLNDDTGDALPQVTDADTPDIVVVNSGDDSISIFFGQGGGLFDPEIVALVGDNPVSVAAGQLSNDNGDLAVGSLDNVDLVVANQGDNDVTVLLGDGLGAFTPQVPTTAGGTAPRAVALIQLDDDNGDTLIDDDDLLDLVVANGGSDDVSVLLGNGDGTFTDQGAVAVGGETPMGMAIDDMNVDGLMDVVVLNAGDGIPGGVAPSVSVLMNNGLGGLGPAVNSDVDRAPEGFALGDLDGDTAPDLIVTSVVGGEDPLNQGQPHAGNIDSVAIGGQLTDSTIAAGVTPGDDGLYGTVDDFEAPGTSVIGKMTVRDGYGLNPGLNTVWADTGIYEKFLTGARLAGLNVPLTDDAFITNTLDGAGDDFGGDLGQKTYELAYNDGVNNGILTIKFSGEGRANFDPLPADPQRALLTLERTTAKSSLTIQFKGEGVYVPVIDIIGSDDSALRSLKTNGGVFLGNIGNPDRSDPIDGGVGMLSASNVAADAVWTLPGGVKSAKLGALAGVDIQAGEIKSWSMTGDFTDGVGAARLAADSLGSFKSRGLVDADVSAALGGAKTFSVSGHFDGNLDTFLDVKSIKIGGAFLGVATIARGDMSTMSVGDLFTGRVDVLRGEVRSVKIRGDFGLNLLGDDTAFRASGGIGTFSGSGDFHGLLSSDGDIKTVKASKGVLTGKIRAHGSIKSASFAAMEGALAAAGSDFLTISVAGDMYDSAVFAGFDPGDAGWSADPAARAANVQIDAFTAPAFRTFENTDQALGGDIKRVTVKGEMGRQYVAPDWLFRPCSISAGVDPGMDGYLGSNDDMVAGTGTIGKVVVKGGIYGDNIDDTYYGIFAASEMPTVTAWRGDAFGGNDNVFVGAVEATVGSLRIVDVNVQLRSLSVRFSHAINESSINNAFKDATRPTTFELLVSVDDEFGDGDDVNISDTVPNTLTYDPDEYTVTMTLNGTETWDSLALGANYQLTIYSPEVMDTRGSPLDGEYTGVLPSGNRRPGGDFIYPFLYGQQILDTVPSYLWHHGCVPTSAGMLMGYYDGFAEFSDLIPGSADVQTAAVSEVIASSGKDLDGDGFIDINSGHEVDYALFDGVDDNVLLDPYRDLSDPQIQGSRGVTELREYDCLADFLHTSFSFEGLKYGWSWVDQIGPGVQDYVAWVSGGTYNDVTGHWENGLYEATTEWYWYPANSMAALWNIFIAEINQGRPVLMSVNTDLGTDTPDHCIIGIGYNAATMQYACFDTWTYEVQWHSFEAPMFGTTFGVSSLWTVSMSRTP